jgi:hypothetical protein
MKDGGSFLGKDVDNLICYNIMTALKPISDFLPRPFQFIIHCHSTIQRYIVRVTDIAFAQVTDSNNNSNSTINYLSYADNHYTK